MHKKILRVALLEAFIAFSCINALSETSTPFDSGDDSDVTVIQSDAYLYLNKHESFKTCFSFDLEPDEYVVFPNKTAFVPIYNKTYEEHFYILYGDYLRICAPPEILNGGDLDNSSKSSISLRYLTIVGLGVSMVFLLIHIVVFVLVPGLKNLPGWNLASLCFALLCSYTAMVISENDYITETPSLCISAAVCVQFFFLASFLWMCIISFDVFRSMMTAVENLRKTNKEFKVKKYVINSIISWGVALIFTAAALITDRVEGVDETLKPHFEMHCWFKSKQSLLLFFAGPVFTLIVVNFLLFGVTAHRICSSRSKSQQLNSNNPSMRKTYLMYLKLAIIMGATWIVGALAPVVNILFLWYLFATLNTLQGFFIFVAFTCTEKVRKYLKLSLLEKRRKSEVSQTAPTFQSYCNYSNSIEKDLDKIVDNKDKSAQIDTIVIHI
ncbi:g-protein coupled receptor Mth2 [Trichonephila clavipes]|uniref:G-protein coupled receptor Mth2 n=1 Tax=Trichonephila clavipes TaxID=2585209 RepID=A0A8X7BBI3_TRICX|nr:g-protein coupled receptor Mth2 [Trichonephila clavipes]